MPVDESYGGKNWVTIIITFLTNTVYIHISLFQFLLIELCYFSLAEFTFKLFKYQHFEGKGEQATIPWWNSYIAVLTYSPKDLVEEASNTREANFSSWSLISWITLLLRKELLLHYDWVRFSNNTITRKEQKSICTCSMKVHQICLILKKGCDIVKSNTEHVYSHTWAKWYIYLRKILRIFLMYLYYIFFPRR